MARGRDSRLARLAADAAHTDSAEFLNSCALGARLTVCAIVSDALRQLGIDSARAHRPPVRIARLALDKPALGIARIALLEPAVRVPALLFSQWIYKHALLLRGRRAPLPGCRQKGPKIRCDYGDFSVAIIRTGSCHPLHPGWRAMAVGDRTCLAPPGAYRRRGGRAAPAGRRRGLMATLWASRSADNKRDSARSRSQGSLTASTAVDRFCPKAVIAAIVGGPATCAAH